MQNIILTVFTPTYNRKELLARAFESLCAQTSKEFKWLIVDDGSTDDTAAEVKSWLGVAPFEIEYRHRENGGKMRAHNTGASLCTTELFVCLDSDDILAPEAVERIIEKWREFKDCHYCMKKSAERAGIVAYKGIKEGDEIKLLSEKFPSKARELGYSTLRGLYLSGFKGETTLVYRTELLRKYPFPEIEGEKYVPEDYVYDQIDSEAPLILMDSVLTVCELVEGGYTDQAARLRRENPIAWRMYYEQRMHLQRWSLLKIKYISHYIRLCSVTGEKPKLRAPERVAGTLGALVLSFMNKT